uniref:Cell division coordinator CpoB n=1 Tax=Candidatus Kentrum sp. DK TaxID=2126562 RepID=A0A450T740_9GAMM|nr:MAG: tol-pal system protein YbgF [Candidatus Kentron sp. DK]
MKHHPSFLLPHRKNENSDRTDSDKAGNRNHLFTGPEDSERLTRRANVFIRLVAVFVCCALPYGAMAETADSGIQDRLDRMERMLSSKALMGLLGRIDALQGEIRELRGQIEVQNHELSRMGRHYSGMEQRLRRLETAAGLEVAAPAERIDSSELEILHPIDPRTLDRIPGQKASENLGESPSTRPMGSASPAPLTGSSAEDPEEEQQAYQEAFELLKTGAYNKAITALRAFLTRYPDSSRYAQSAQYWLSEAYYVTQQYRPALEEFRKFIGAYPSSPNFTDALLKIGYIQYELGQKTKARKTLTDLIEQYPGTTEAHLARTRLRKIGSGTPP